MIYESVNLKGVVYNPKQNCFSVQSIIEATLNLSRALDVSREIYMWFLPLPLSHNDLHIFNFISCTFSFFIFISFLSFGFIFFSLQQNVDNLLNCKNLE